MAWMLKAEYDFLISSLSERLDTAKCRGFLSCSLDMRLVDSFDPAFLHYVGLGKTYLGGFIVKHLNRTGLGLQSRYMHHSLSASIVDECNLAHIVQVLRMEELLEAHSQCLSVSVAASILLAVVGELDAVKTELQRIWKGKPELDSFKQDSVRFLTHTLQSLVDFIVESGRDRFTYIKEALILPTATPPRPGPGLGSLPPESAEIAADLVLARNPFGLAARFARDDSNADDAEGGREYLASLYALYRRGDQQLEVLLNSGSILSIWRRLHALFDLPRATARDLVRWAVIRQVPRLNRLRQLIFTRLLQVLCNPSLRVVAGNEVAPDLEKKTAKRDALIGYTVLSAFADSGVRVWCYESESQKIDILRGGGAGDIAKKVVSILCIRVDRGFIDLPMGDERPDEDTLERWLAPQWQDARRDGHEYSRLDVTDSNLYRLVPKNYSSGGFGDRPSVTSVPIGGRSLAIVPDFALSGDHRFFRAPLTTAFFNSEKFEATVEDFLKADGVEC
ncbi:hypothetical protein BESB_023630 [Besnoitia besnoiti]|uniref:Uncharacterized protein n=1 Tax=Besnoitia besnoiti TaxID=94643 RepID=A0A2A9M6D0_BESBE|nr:hypothetical protein BESB_023630 [Besnoitia besnoiti]PFH31871.1 hypothetical protein BESB_023630 [Besnoitia besnoiti]